MWLAHEETHSCLILPEPRLQLPTAMRGDLSPAVFEMSLVTCQTAREVLVMSFCLMASNHQENSGWLLLVTGA